ncbi:MAG: tyrosine-type recombinase/integrase, partial [Solirubrobacterales bacterium]
IAERDDVKVNTATVYKLTRRNLVDFFGADKPIASITPYDAEQWRRELTRLGLSEATARKRAGTAKLFFSTAVKRRAITENPFAGLKSAAISNESRRYFLGRADADKIMEACPDTEWRLIFVLARFAGLRTPSETLALKWTDILEDKILVHSSKTERHEGKAVRFVPLFPELREPLKEAFDQAEPGEVYCISRHRKRSCNLRTQFQRIIERAGLKPWPKLFQNLRSTRETELAESWPLHVVVAWLGNSQLVAAKHYLQVTDEHFRKASQASQNATQPTSTISGKPEQPSRSDVATPSGFPEGSEVCSGLQASQGVLPGAVFRESCDSRLPF